jgi:glucose 1-dehydrogenase
MRGLTGLRVLITGAAQGIGRATAERFAAEGARVALNDLDTPILHDSVAALPDVAAGPHLAVPGDVADEVGVERIFAQTLYSLGGLDVLINNAGITGRASSERIDINEFDRVLAVNLRGTVLCARAAIAHFRAAGIRGCVLNTASVHETIPKPFYLAYAASKGAIGNVTRTLALEYAEHGIRVNEVAPGAIVTPINASWTDDAERRAIVESHIPQGRAGEAAEIAAAFAFLASDDARYITGHTLTVDGGLSLYNDFRTNWAT